MKIEGSEENRIGGNIPIIVPPQAARLYERGVAILYGVPSQKDVAPPDLREMIGAWHLVRAAAATEDPDSLNAIQNAVLPYAGVVLPALEEERERDIIMGRTPTIDKLKLTREKTEFMAMLLNLQSRLG